MRPEVADSELVPCRRERGGRVLLEMTARPCDNS